MRVRARKRVKSVTVRVLCCAVLCGVREECEGECFLFLWMFWCFCFAFLSRLTHPCGGAIVAKRLSFFMKAATKYSGRYSELRNRSKREKNSLRYLT